MLKHFFFHHILNSLKFADIKKILPSQIKNQEINLSNNLNFIFFKTK